MVPLPAQKVLLLNADHGAMDIDRRVLGGRKSQAVALSSSEEHVL